MLDGGRAVGLKIVAGYCFPNLKLAIYKPMAERFVKTYQKFPPGETDHELRVVVNGAKLAQRQMDMFHPIADGFDYHNNFAKDIGAYMTLALTRPCDLMVCLGAHVHFHRAGWLDRMVDVYLQNGPGLYGCWGFMSPAPHIRTTAFWLPPELLTTYPYKLGNEHRYQFEHGRDRSILAWARQCGFPVMMVGWNFAAPYGSFRHVPASECLMLDQHTDRVGYK